MVFVAAKGNRAMPFSRQQVLEVWLRGGIFGFISLNVILNLGLETVESGTISWA